MWLYTKCHGDTFLCIDMAFIFLRGGGVMHTDKFMDYIDNLPKDCIEMKTDQKIQFHLPKEKQICPSCGSAHVLVNNYHCQTLQKLNTDVTYVYNHRRYRCADCGKTFTESAPFIAPYQRTLANPLRQARARKKLTQNQVIEACGIPYHVYKAYEAANATIPPLLTALKIARFLDVDVQDIWGDAIT